jgi:hypothetical protein
MSRYKNLRPGGHGYIDAGVIWVDEDRGVYVRSGLWVASKAEEAGRFPILVTRSLTGRIALQFPAGKPDWCWARGAHQRKPGGGAQPRVFTFPGEREDHAVAVDRLSINGVVQPTRQGTSLMPVELTQSRTFDVGNTLEGEWKRFEFPNGMRQYQLTREETQQFLTDFIRAAAVTGDAMEHVARVALVEHLLHEVEWDEGFAGDAQRDTHADAASYYLLEAQAKASTALELLTPAFAADDEGVLAKAERLRAYGEWILGIEVPNPSTTWLPLIERAKRGVATLGE